MRVELFKRKIILSIKPEMGIPKALLILAKDKEPVYTDIIVGKSIYSLPKGIKEKDVISIYLRIL